MKKTLLAFTTTLFLFASAAQANGIYRVEDNKKFDSWKTETIAFSDHAISFVNSGATLKCQNKVLTSSEEKEINKIVKKGFNKKDVSKVMNCEATDGDGVLVIIMNDQGHDRDVLLFGTGIETDSPIKLLKL